MTSPARPEALDRFVDLVSSNDLALPLPGKGCTAERWQRLALFGENDLCVAKLAEAHADADAILGEIAGDGVGPGERWGVWAAGGPVGLEATAAAEAGWQLTGAKSWCSGVVACTHGLVTAETAAGSALFAVELTAPGVGVLPGSWAGAGMSRADTRTITFDHTPARLVGHIGEYLTRPGFWLGAIGIAAVWLGGARAVARPLYERVSSGRADLHQQAHLGAVDMQLWTARTALDAVAAEVDSAPDRDWMITALRCRALAEQVAGDVIHHVGRALGPGPYVSDRDYARHVDDLPVYVRQSHAERDLAELGRAVSVAPGEAPPGAADGAAR